MTQRIGVLGGTFDPIHYGHLILGEQAREQLDLDRVLFIPANFPWRKAEQEITPATQRLEMLRLATDENPAFSISTAELDRGGPSYTADTLESISAENRGAELFFLLGEDALQDLPNWRDPDRIIASAWLAVADRPGSAPRPAPPTLADRIVRIDMPDIGITATLIRDAVTRGTSIRYLAPDAVVAFIAANDLYT